MGVLPRVEVAVAVVVAAALGAGWAHVARREHAIAAARAARVTPILQGPVRECARMQRFETSTSEWVWDANVKAAGWDAPPHLEGLPPDRTFVEYVDTSRGRVAWVQAGHEETPAGYAHWLALLADGPLDADHAPAARAQRGDVFAYQPYVGELGGGFFVASGARDGTLEQLGPDLRTLRVRTGVAPRANDMPAMNYFVEDGRHGLYFLSYGAGAARVHHVDADLNDVVPARTFDVPGDAGQRWNPFGLGVEANRVCVEVECRLLDRGTSRDCGRRHLVLDGGLEPSVWLPLDSSPDRVAPRVRMASLVASAVTALVAMMLAGWFATRTSRRREALSPGEATAPGRRATTWPRVGLYLVAAIEASLLAYCLLMRSS